MALYRANRINLINRLEYRWLKLGIIGLSLIVLTLVGVIGYKYWQNSRPILSGNLKKEIVFPVFWPDKSEPVTVNKSTLKYDTSSGLVSYTIQTPSSNSLVVSEQSTPEDFTASPQVYSNLIQAILEYEQFSSRNGTVYLTHPKGTSGETAVMNSQGTLMFVKASKNLSDSAWRQFFNNLQTIN